MNIRRWLLPLLALAASTAACGGGAATIESKGGADAGPTCGEGTVDCGGTCVSTSNDPKNCGACGTTCKDGEVCSSGACGAGCAGSGVDGAGS